MRHSPRRMIATVVAAVAVAAGTLAASPAYAATSTIVAAPTGSGSTCSVQAPCSLTGAQTKARSAASAGNAVDVVLRGGTYALSQTFQLRAEDSGTAQAPVTYKAYDGESPVLSGARTLSSWTDLGNGTYSAPTNGADFRQLYVNGVRATPARFPNVGSNVQLMSSDTSAKTLGIQAAQFANFGNADLSQIDMVLELQWGESYLRLKDATTSGDQTKFTLQDTEANILFQRPYPLLSNGSPIHFENARQFLDQPGEFFVDRKAGQIFYKPRAGESLSSSYTVPTIDTLLDVIGSASAPVHDIAIRGIAFRDSNWTRPTQYGYLNGQGGMYNLSANTQNQQYTDRPPAAVHVNYADRIQITDNTFARMGSTALDLNTAVHDSSVVGNIITDTSGNGILVGKFTDANVEYHTPYHPSDINEVTARVTIANNVISGTGKVYYGTAGINGGYLRNTSIVHNDISDSPWAGITTGWGWVSEETAQRENTISYNRIHNVVNMLCDTAAIYHLSNDPGTVFDGNYLHDIVRTPGACGSAVAGFYMDEGSANLAMRNNVIADSNGFINYNRVGQLEETNNTTENKDVIQAAGLEANYRGLLQRINLAAGKPTSSSSEYSWYTRASNAVDGDLGTGWSPTGTDTSAWWQVDLGTASPIGQVSLTTRQDMSQPETRRNFEVRASNDPSFSSYAVLARRDDATIADAGTFTANVYDSGSYRYIRVAATAGQYFWITEFSAQAATGVGGNPTVPTFDQNTAYTLTNVNSGLLADVYQASKDDAAPLAQWQNNGGANQKWYLRQVGGSNLFRIISVDSGKAMDVEQTWSRGDRVKQWSPDRGASQLWTIEPRGDSFVIRNFLSRQVMEVGGASTSNGANLNQWMDLNQTNGMWRITAVN